MSQDVGGSVVQEVASLEARTGGRTADQRLMVNGVALSSMIQGGWGGGAVPNATGTVGIRGIDVSAVDAQAATGGVRINFIPRDGGNRDSGTVFASLATDQLRQRQLQRAPMRVAAWPDCPEHDQGERKDSNPGFGGPLVRDKLWFFVSARYLFCRELRGRAVLQREREPGESLRLRALVPRSLVTSSGPADGPRPSFHLAGQRQEQVRRHGRLGELLRLHHGPFSDGVARGGQRSGGSPSSVSSRWTGTLAGQQQAAASRRAQSIASSGGAACTRRWARRGTSIPDPGHDVGDG